VVFVPQNSNSNHFLRKSTSTPKAVDPTEADYGGSIQLLEGVCGVIGTNDVFHRR